MKSKNFSLKALSCLVLLTMTSVTALAQTEKPKTNSDSKSLQQATTQEDDDDKLDESFRKFGNAAGAAYQCTPEAEREKLVADVMQAYSRIGRLFGTDRAFYFAVHFGTSSQGGFDKAKCPELLKKLRESVLIRRSGTQ